MERKNYIAEFIRLAFDRVEKIKILLNEDSITSSIRLLYYKELYGIFDELNKIAGADRPKKNQEILSTVTAWGYFDGKNYTSMEVPTLPNKTMWQTFEEGYARDLLEIVAFVRNLLFHFPIFEKWDDIYISKNMTLTLINPNNDPSKKNMKGEIYNFLNKPKAFDSLSFNKRSTPSVIYPKITSDEEIVFLKDIIDEKSGALLIIEAMEICFLKQLKKRV